MKKNLIALVALLCFTLSAGAQGIKFFNGTLKQAVEQAAKENKLVFVDVYAVWCGPCKRMEATTFKDAEVGKYYNEHFVSIQIDSERGEGPTIHTKYAVQGLPSYLFLDHEGNIVHRSGSYQKVDKFLKIGREAVEYSKDPKSVGKYAARYEQEKNNLSFLKEYLDKLKQSKAAGYYEVVEQYLKVNKDLNPNSMEAVQFLYDHRGSLTYGGEAQKIFDKYLGTFAWDKFVRKQIRKEFQQIWLTLAKNTTEYAIDKKDSKILEMTFRESATHGAKGNEEQVWMHFYKMTQDAANYKKMAKPMIDAFVAEIKPEWSMEYQAYLKFKEENPMTRPFCDGKSGKLRSLVVEYAKFATADDKADMLRWGKQAYSMLNNPENTSFYAKIQYMFGDKEAGIQMMRNNLEATKTVGKYEANQKDMDLMEQGLPVPITF